MSGVIEISRALRLFYKLGVSGPSFVAIGSCAIYPESLDSFRGFGALILTSTFVGQLLCAVVNPRLVVFNLAGFPSLPDFVIEVSLHQI